MNDIGKRIKHRRKELGYSAEKLAELVGVSPATIYRYEKNDIANMGADKLRPIADALSTTPGALMGWEEEREEDAFVLREEYRRDPNRRLLLSLAKHGSAKDVRQVAAIIDALKATNPDFYDGDDPA
ncbi:MAG: helix-turn-helix domain-containing protein [bacterium]